MKLNAFVTAAVALSTLPAMIPAASAQVAPKPNYNIGDAVREAAPPKPPVEKPTEMPVLPEVTDEPLSLSDGQTIFIREFRLENAELADQAQLLALLEPYRNKDLSLSEIYAAANKITVFYRENGYLVAKAYVPKQDAGTGILTIKVVVGKYGALTFKNASPVHDFLIEGAFAEATDSSGAVSKDDLERAMLLVSDMPGARMPKLTLAPGGTPGTTDFVVETGASERFGGYVLADNFGSRYTGRNRVSAGLEVNAPFGMADKLSLAAMSSEAAGLQNGRAAYAFPLHYSGLRAEVAAARTTYKLGDIYRDLEATGVANTWEGTLSYPLKRTRDDSVTAMLNVAAKRLHDRNAGNEIDPRNAQVATAGLSKESYGTLFGFKTATNLQAALSFGHLDFANNADEVANAAGADTAGIYSKFNVGAASNIAFTDEWSLSGAFKGQKALRGKNLDGSEQMSISGPYGVQVYPEGVSGDNGYLFSAQVKYALPQIGDFRHALGLLSELGRVYLQDNNYTGRETGTRLTDIGLGYYSNFEYADGKYAFGTVQAMRILGPQQETGERSAKAKILAQIGLTF